MTANQPPTGDAKTCDSCGKPLPAGADVGADTCPDCAAQPSPPDDDMIRPLGGERLAPPPPPSHPPAPAPPPPPRQPTPPETAQSKPAPTSHPRLAQGVAAYAKELWVADRWFAIVLAIILVQGVFALLVGSWFGVAVAAIVFWGLLAYNYWVYIIVVFLYGLNLLGAVFNLLAGYGMGITGLIDLAITAVIFGVLIDRHDQYL